MTILDKLRPQEIVYLIAHSRGDSVKDEALLESTLAHLHREGYIAKDEEGVICRTEAGDSMTSVPALLLSRKLRGYEKGLLCWLPNDNITSSHLIYNETNAINIRNNLEKLAIFRGQELTRKGRRALEELAESAPKYCSGIFLDDARRIVDEAKRYGVLRRKVGSLEDTNTISPLMGIAGGAAAAAAGSK